MVGGVTTTWGTVLRGCRLGKFITTALSLKYLLYDPCWGSPLELPSPNPSLCAPRGGPSHGAAHSRPRPKKMVGGGGQLPPLGCPRPHLQVVWGVVSQLAMWFSPVVSPLPLWSPENALLSLKPGVLFSLIGLLHGRRDLISGYKNLPILSRKSLILSLVWAKESWNSVCITITWRT